MGEYSLSSSQQRRISKCHSKRAYTEDFADYFANQYKQFKYHCGICNYWHLSSYDYTGLPKCRLNETK